MSTSSTGKPEHNIGIARPRSTLLVGGSQKRLRLSAASFECVADASAMSLDRPRHLAVVLLVQCAHHAARRGYSLISRARDRGWSKLLSPDQSTACSRVSVSTAWLWGSQPESFTCGDEDH